MKCPLYALGPDCGGHFTYKESGVKDCTRCALPHRRENFGYVVSKARELCRRVAEERSMAATGESNMARTGRSLAYINGIRLHL